MIKQFAKLLIIAGALSIAAVPAMSVAKTCHQEAKAKHLKGKEAKKFIHECLEKRKKAHKKIKHEKKMEHKKEVKKQEKK
ncbi:MAG: PsiF family protein [Gammaproteobacteria bacterium]|jgi:hypothetical protein